MLLLLVVLLILTSAVILARRAKARRRQADEAKATQLRAFRKPPVPLVSASLRGRPIQESNIRAGAYQRRIRRTESEP